MEGLRDMLDPIRILIVEDHVVFADTLSLALGAQPDMAVVGVAKDEKEALKVLQSRPCDIVLMDMHLEASEGLEIIDTLRQVNPGMAILMLTAVKDPRSAAFAISHGAAGFLTKDMPLGEVIRGIRDASRGRTVMDSSMASEVLSILAGRRQRIGDNLTPREVEVLRMLDLGRSAAEIAKELNISLNTIRNHIARIISKLESHSMHEAVAIARREGILT